MSKWTEFGQKLKGKCNLMAVYYVTDTKKDYEDIIDFANYVFSHAHNPHDFKKTLPKLYSDENTVDGIYHYVCKEDDKIKALVLLQKSDVKVGDYTLKVGGIGTVSAHPYSRGKGYMKKLMNDSVQEIRESCDLGFLGGQRQRYQYFGFEIAGTELLFNVNEDNVKHVYKDVATDDVKLVTITNSDKELIKEVRNLQKSIPLLGVRNGSDEQFLNIMHSWNNKLIALTDNDEFKGYLVKGGNGYIGEIYLKDPALLPKFIKKLLDENSKTEFKFTLNETQMDLIPQFAKLCENVKKSTQYSFLLANPKKVLEAFLNLKLSYKKLSDGCINIEISGKTYKITVENGHARVLESDEKPLVSFTEFEALTQLFSPNGNLMGELDILPDFAKSWFPLPLYLASADGC